MADTVTANFEWVKPEITGSASTWGNKWNANLDLIDTAIFGINANISARLPLVGGTLTGVVHSTVADGGGDQLVTHDQAAAIATTVVTAYMPVGIISLWSGSIGSIPAHWHLCDGTGGTPDLRDKFIVGAGGTYAFGANGGAVSSTPTITVAGHSLTIAELAAHGHGITDTGHSHGITDPGHSHNIKENFLASGPTASIAVPSSVTPSTNAATDAAATGISVNGATTGITVNNTGSGTAHSHGASSSAVPTLPPYLALAYIMRV